MSCCCADCIFLDRHRVRCNKSNGKCWYGCGTGKAKERYIVGDIKIDSELRKQGCSDWREKKILKPGDVVEYEANKVKVRYLYCGKVQGKRLLYGGKLINGKAINCRCILAPDELTKHMSKDTKFCVCMRNEEFAQRKKEEYLKGKRK